MSQARFQKMQREKAKREKAQAKAERKALRAEEADADVAAEPVADQSKVLAELAELHERFDADEIDFDTFDEKKQELIAQLDV